MYFIVLFISYILCARIYYLYYFSPSSKVISNFYLNETIQNQDFCEKQPPYLTILVFSIAECIDKRQVIRETWGNVNHYPEKMKRFKVLFLLFKRPSIILNDKVKSEGEMYKDILLFDFTESYFHSMYKIMSGYIWIQEHCPGTQFIAKADDDVLLDIVMLLNKLYQNMDKKDEAIFGSSVKFGHTKRFGKHPVSYKAYPFIMYPRYCIGPLYVMSSEMAFRTIHPSSRLTFVWPEDVFLTGIVREVLKFNIIELKLEENVNSSEFPSNVSVAFYELKPSEIRDTWTKLQNKDV
ncbi:hypothetical protein LOTGIDRAFT_143702 [Lottia gigantea]|uniref:Hexosyltransferase n=1 Tax=Lottia gigantea TaxID=225164 RepID=V4AID9_LOTGI|nr:hypothetical protein LOTGIDRAFT_143702 [Lottia gigantea]ESO96732.1 hypothetical protein LOTGIDRAFT_143702 [Lottia gigantea]